MDVGTLTATLAARAEAVQGKSSVDQASCDHWDLEEHLGVDCFGLVAE